ncbi:galactokinase [Coemansia erecta]|nr:galactokinase [Coemansia erecta]
MLAPADSTLATVPTFNALSDIYTSDLLKHAARFQLLTEAFIATYGFKPSFIVRAPGRVNIIGEHIDYCGFPVFPMAIVPDSLIAVRATREHRIRLANINPKYPSREFSCESGSSVTINNTTHEWTNYFKCGYKGAIEAIDCTNPQGMECLMDSSVPSSAGLSSSSAIVCCAVLATMKVNGRLLPKGDVVETAVASERYIGTNGGGMDQTTSIMSQSQSAVFIEFDPELKITPVKFPSTDPQITFVIANTLVVSDKAVTAPVCYNLRVVETRIGALILAKHLGIADHRACKDADPLTFKVVMDEYFATQDTAGSDDVQVWIDHLDAMLHASTEAFGAHPDGYTREQMAAVLDMTPDALSAAVHEDRFPVRAQQFKLLQRAQHAFSEALRVVKFRQICESGDIRLNYCTALGDLMNCSQDSCRDLFECSCPEIDELCALARRSGSFGSRLTGAGWGGCTVHLVLKDRVGRFIAALKREFYEKHVPNMNDEALSDAIFVTTPGNGAAFYMFD